MSEYAYIDESGTLSEHKLMTVSLVLVTGRRTADNIADRILKAAYGHLSRDEKALEKKELHFAYTCQMLQNRIALLLAREKLLGIVISHWHAGSEESHQMRFLRYTRMVQRLLWKALEQTSGDITVVIAKQGSPESYKMTFFSDLTETVDLFRKRTGKFRKITFELKPAKTRRGLQLADFYAGAVRKMWLETRTGVDAEQCAPYKHLRHQIILESYIEL